MSKTPSTAEGLPEFDPQLLLALAENSDDFICLANSHGRPFYLNKAARRLADLDEGADLSAANLHDYCSDESWIDLRDVGVPAVNKTGRWEGSCQLRDRKHDKLLDVDTTMLKVRGLSGDGPACLAIIHREAGLRRRMEEALAEGETRKRAILESALDPIVAIDHDGLITEFNRAAEQVFGHPREKVLGRPPSEILFPPAKIAGYRNRIDRYLDAGEGSMLGKRFEVTAVRADGETFPAEMAMTISRQNGLPVLIFFVRDISQQKSAEEERERYANELERSNKELEQFAYIASHDLQEPLRKIRTFGDRLQTKYGQSLDEPGRECVERMQSAAARMQDLISDLLTLSRVTTKVHEFVPTDLAQVAAEAVSDLESRIEQAEGRVEIGHLPTIQADPLQMRELFQNLIANALKFRRADVPPVVRVQGRFVKGRKNRTEGSTAADELCRIEVADNGIGFDEKYLDRIFKIFQRLHTREAYEGTGMGLAICRRIAERHGGTISAQSTPGRGSNFTVVLPVVHRKKER